MHLIIDGVTYESAGTGCVAFKKGRKCLFQGKLWDTEDVPDQSLVTELWKYAEITSFMSSQPIKAGGYANVDGAKRCEDDSKTLRTIDKDGKIRKPDSITDDSLYWWFWLC